jgi:transcription-repair coupling factor (superfamily II helicase)
MNLFFTKIKTWLNSNNPTGSFELNDIELNTWLGLNQLESNILQQSKKPIIFIVKESEVLDDLIQALAKKYSVLHLSHPHNGPYEKFISASNDTDFFISTLKKVFSKEFDFLFLTMKSLFWSVPEIKNQDLEGIHLIKEDIIAPHDLKTKLIKLGYIESFDASHPGTFAHRGEIFDIHLINNKIYRLNYFDELIEFIFPVDPETLKSLRDEPLESIDIAPSSTALFTEENIQILRKNIPQPSPQFRGKHSVRREILKKAQNLNLFDNAIYFLPFFFEQRVSIFDYFKDEALFIFQDLEASFGSFEQYLDDMDVIFQEENQNENSEIVLPEITQIYQFQEKSKLLTTCKSIQLNTLKINDFKNDIDIQESVDFNSVDLNIFLQYSQALIENPLLAKRAEKFDFFIKKITKENFREKLFFYSSNENKEKFKLLIEEKNLNFKFIDYPLNKSFYYPSDNTLVLSDQYFFSKTYTKIKKKKRKKKYDLFAEQISTLQNGDYVIHKKHGIGKFLGIQNLSTSSENSDFVVILYKDDDKVYVPVHNLDLVQKYGDSNSELKLADLKSKKFQLSTIKAKSSVKELAFSLIKLQAQREAFQGYAFSEPGEEYEKFSALFPYALTPDQDQAITDILADMSEIRPMDRLVCGDVGFGKTEVAMRASFKAIEDGKQVAILVPTTILCLQHYMNFKERFKDFPINIEFLSRLKTTKESNAVVEKVNEGKIDIIIGTHQLLGQKLKYKNLGLLVIDEEHRFGVSHKEKLKILKSSIDFLTLTATPIPRTLQLSFLGIKELSLIQTAPPKRKSINTYIVREDKHTLRTAIQTELHRGGQVFFIHNKVSDIEIIVGRIRELVPNAKIVYAHGQMNEKELEKRIYDFYSKKYDILVATTIVESGIDIPTANTMIINSAQNFGVAQLHQLRGRIGRSQRKAYCYFVIPKHKNLSDTATKRLEALQKYTDLGSGFAIANSDLDIRGAGNILGAEQSGHIHSIGLELYLELLQEAVHEIKGEVIATQKTDCDVSAFFSSYIPESYISDQQARLKFYKRISNCENEEELLEAKEEMQDIFGDIPQVTLNLVDLIAIKSHCNRLGIKQARFKEKTTTLYFDQEYLEANQEYRTKIIKFFMNLGGRYKIKPNSSVVIEILNKTSQDCLKVISNIATKLSNI